MIKLIHVVINLYSFYIIDGWFNYIVMEMRERERYWYNMYREREGERSRGVDKENGLRESEREKSR